MVLALQGSAQMVQQKHLLIGLAGGGGYTNVISNVDTLSTTGLLSSATRFSFGYALGRRWSLGGHWDRIGSVAHPHNVDRLRFTTYMLEGSFRPIQGERWSLELTVAGGVTIMALRPKGRLIPYGSQGAVGSVGIRYLRLLNSTFGLHLSLDHAQAAPQDVKYHDEPLQVLPELPMNVTWHGQRFTGGVFVRF